MSELYLLAFNNIMRDTTRVQIRLSIILQARPPEAEVSPECLTFILL